MEFKKSWELLQSEEGFCVTIKTSELNGGKKKTRGRRLCAGEPPESGDLQEIKTFLLFTRSLRLRKSLCLVSTFLFDDLANQLF